MSAVHDLAAEYAAVHPPAAASRIHELPTPAAAAFLADLEPAAAAAVLAELWPGVAAAVVTQLAPEDAARLVERVPPTRAVAVLRLLGEARREPIVGSLPPPLAARLRQLLTLPPGTAGAIADPSFVSWDADATAGEVRARGGDPRLPYVYVVDAQLRLVGVVHRRDLAAADDGAPLRTLMSTRLQRLPAAAPVALLHDHGAWAELDALPVVDAGGRMVGVIRHKDLRATPLRRRVDAGPGTAVNTLLDLGEAYWSGMVSALTSLAADEAAPSAGEEER